MDTESPESKIKEENNGTSATEAKQELPFKKPVLLIGKIGRLPRKVQAVSLSNTNPEKTPFTFSEDTSTETIERKLMKNSSPQEDIPENTVQELPEIVPKSPAQQQLENSLMCPYKEPNWSGLPDPSGKPYTFEVLKNGRIIETIDLMKKPFWVFGRLATCDICMQHPTISRYHAIIQYRDIPSENDPPGFYVYDLGSTHGTFLNGKHNKLKPKMYAPIRVGHMIRLGCSQRSYILTGPEDDQEDESELSVTELKQLKEQKIRAHQEKIRQAELEMEEKKKREEERGVDWGMGDDADDEEDLAENPYASTNNEELYLDDPKKALRGFFEREGIELDYDCSEQGMGQFLCKVELPVDDEMGRPIVAEVLHRGKKKEAVIQCALEACRILDRFGVLRQATHESKKRKARNWEENDYYDSDEDTFLDRTGTIEKKREKRMKVKEPEKAETYESLVQKEQELTASIAEIEKKLGQVQAKVNKGNSSTSAEEDSLDSYMRGLDDEKPDKQAISKLRLNLANLKKVHANVIRLVNIAKPANLPQLVPSSSLPSTSSGSPSSKSSLPIFGKRRTGPYKFPAKPSSDSTMAKEFTQTSKEVTEEESEEEMEAFQATKESIKLTSQRPAGPSVPIGNKNIEDSPKACINNSVKEEIPATGGESSNISRTEDLVDNSNLQTRGIIDTSGNTESPVGTVSESDSSDGEPVAILEEFRPIKTFHDTETFKRFEKIMRTGLPAVADKHKQKLVKILRKLQRLASNEDRMHSDWKILSAKKRKVMKWIEELRDSETNEKLEFRVSTELNRILGELSTMTEDKFKVIGQVKQMGYALKSISMEIDKDIQQLKHGIDTDAVGSCKEPEGSPEAPLNNAIQQDQKPGTSEEPLDNLEAEELDDKKKKKNQKRNEQRQHKAELERQRGYEEDASRENYTMWVPPNNQSGDGRTNLNDKLGY